MSQLWSAFVANTIARYTTGAQGAARENAAIQAVADYAKSQIIREVEADLPLRQSYLNSYKEAKVALAGYTITSSFNDVLAAVKVRITVDGSRDGISEASGYLDKMVQHGIDDFNGVATLFNAHLVDAAIEIQRKVRCYQGPFETAFDTGAAGVTNTGHVTEVTLPTGCELSAVRYGKKYTALAGNTAYVAGDQRESNGRIYECVTAGTSANPIGAGLTSTDGENETTGTAVFKYIGSTDYSRAVPVAWSDRYALIQSTSSFVPSYTVNTTGEKLLFHPALDADHNLRIEYLGLKTSFANGDTVPFDQPCEVAAANYVRAMLLTHVAENTRDAGVSMQLWQSAMRRLWSDCYARGAGRA